MVFERELIHASPSLALAKLSPLSAKLILDALQGDLGLRRVLPLAENVAIADMEVDAICGLLYLSDFTSDTGRPLGLALNAPSNPTHSVALKKCAQELDLFLYPESAFKAKVYVAQRVVVFQLQERYFSSTALGKTFPYKLAGDFKVPIDRIEGNHRVVWSMERILEIQKNASMSQPGNKRDAAARLLASLSSCFLPNRRVIDSRCSNSPKFRSSMWQL